jgi:hypothetical protein
MAIGLILDAYMPEELSAWQETQLEGMEIGTMLFMLALIAVALVSVLVATIALLLLKKWGAWLHLMSALPAFIALLMFGPIVHHPVSYIVDSIGMLVTGCLYGVAFFTDALSPGQKPPVIGN